jgi:hypothetical protein
LNVSSGTFPGHDIVMQLKNMQTVLHNSIWSLLPWFSMILLCGIITGLFRTIRLLYEECAPSPFDKSEKAVKSGRIVAFALMAGIMNSVGLLYVSTRIKPRRGEGVLLIGIALLALVYTIMFEISLRARKGNRSDPGKQMIAGGMTGGMLGVFLVLSSALLLMVDGFAWEGISNRSTLLFSSLLTALSLLMIGILIGVIVSGLVILSRFVVLLVHRSVFSIGSHLLFLVLGFKTVMCQNCLHPSIPSKSYYKKGCRYCEHCQACIPRAAASDKDG